MADTSKTAKRGGEFAAFFDGLEALRARVEDPLARKKRLDVDFAELRENLTRHISRFELFRPLLWAFFQGLLRADARLLAEMLLTVLVEALPAAAAAGERGLEAACRFVAAGARELADAGAPGVANRVVLNALARLDQAFADGDQPPGGEQGDRPPAAAREGWTALVRHLFGALPVERDRQLLGYARRVLEHGVRAGVADASLRPVIAGLWAELVERVLASVTPGTRSPALDHLLVRLDRLVQGAAALPDGVLEPLVGELCALPRFKAWWSGWVERQPPGSDRSAALPPALLELARRALRDPPAGGEKPAQLTHRLRALATIGGAAALPHIAAPLTSDDPLCRRAAVEALSRLHGELTADDPRARGAVVKRMAAALDDPEVDVRRAAVRSLGEVASADLADPLVDLYRRTAEPEQLLRAEILESLVRIAASHAALRGHHGAYLLKERDRHAAMARGRLRDRILAALEKLIA